MKRLWVVTLFPDYFTPLCHRGVASHLLQEIPSQDFPKEFADKNYFEFRPVNLRDHVRTHYKSVDDTPYGGGPGMVMRADILKVCLDEAILPHYASRKDIHIIYPSPRGKIWNDREARQLAKNYLHFEEGPDLVFICGRYEGIDERFLELYVDSHYSLGDFILTGGEIPVMAMLDSALRFVPGVLGNHASTEHESFAQGVGQLEHPHYTRPAEFLGLEVPPVLISGHHARIQAWRQEESRRLTQKYRPDLEGGLK